MKPANFVLLICAVFTVGSASAVVIEYEQVSQSGNTYEYSYTVINDAASTFDIAGISIYFDVGAYENITITGSPSADWDPYFQDPIPALPFDGLADWLSYGATIAAGEALSGFSVMFDWIGGGSGPFATQFFDIYDPDTFGLLESGETQLAGGQSPVDVPEPGSLVLLVFGLLGALRLRRSK